ncbi:ankyrin repeat domain-containing protein [Moraxella sp. Tifton1]|uniref:Ankyrin repeat domain-containing protein n=1 Tax=Moraxella oculi TaxID=2940516 RepID=A0ABW8U7Q3_9GAMM|nr:ankyrin repeat domain-containing protein [Moraxella sp. Tifton1]MCL1624312.1 ankyrin repeat domain-containing protein [Moraxella sp. Tifton1]
MSYDIEFEVYCALMNGEIDIAEKLIDIHKVDCLKVSEVERWNWLHELLMGTNPNDKPVPVKSIQLFIDKGVPVNAQDIYGMTSLHYALRSRNADVAIVLLNAGADPNISNIDGLRPLSMAGYTKERLDVLELMLKKGANVHNLMGDGSGRTILESRKPNECSPQWEIDIYEIMKKYA